MYSNDRTAPRLGKKDFSTIIVSKKLWKEFKKQHGDISWADFYSMWQDIAETIRQDAIYNPLGVKLGKFMGELKYQYLPYAFKSINHGASQQLQEEIPNIALESRGKQGKIKWERRWAVKFNKMLQFYAFEPTRELTLMAKKRTEEDPDSVRVARNTLGGFSIWRKLKNYGK